MKSPLVQHGYGLAETMVSMALGLVLALIACILLTAANKQFINNGAASRIDDSGRFALSILSQALRQASFGGDDAGAPSEQSASVAGFDSASVGRNSESITHPLTAAVNGSDVLAVRYHGSGSPDGSMLNCAGFAVADVPGERAWSIFYVATGTDGEAELRCKYKGQQGWGADAIVRGVDSFQVLYGVDTDMPADGIPNRFLNARAISALDATLPLEGATEEARERDLQRKTYWKRVCTVKLALLLHGEMGSRPDGLLTRYELFGQGYASNGDTGTQIDEKMLAKPLRQRARRLFVTTIALRNPSG